VVTTEREILPGDALKPLRQHFVFIPGFMAGKGAEERSFEPLPHQQAPPDSAEAGALN